MPLSARVSPAAQRVIHDAFTDLSRTISEKDRADFADTTLENVIKAAHEIENQLAARQLLRNMKRLVPLFTGLGYYAKSIEVVCNGTPYLPWIWAPIKLILKVSSDCVNAFEKIITAYARIAEPLARFKILHQTYSKNMEVQQTLAVFYSDILKFHKEAYKFVRRGSWEVFFMTSWGRFQRRFDGIIDDLKAHENLVDKTASVVGLDEARKMREDLVALRQESLDKVTKEEEERTAAQYVAIVGWLKMDDTEQVRIFDSVLEEPQKYSGTCDWIYGQSQMSAWMRCTQESPFLVLHGHPGTGKSVLATQITTFLRSSGNSLVVSHICTYTQAASTEYDQILRSILLQLVRSDTDLVAYIFEEFIFKKKGVTSQALERLLLEVIDAVSNNPSQTKCVHIIVDGLDECDKEKQPKIINFLERMVTAGINSASTICKILVSTHMPPTVAKKLKQKHVVSLSNEKQALGKAIANYAAQRLGALRTRWFQMGITDAELKELETRLTKKADGMFLWARLVLEYLTTNIYGQILAQLISHFDKRSVARLQSIFGWIAFAKRPLRKAELRSALSYSAEAEDVNVDELAPNYLFDMCAPLIEERSDSTFAFIHASVKEFLQSPESNTILDEFSAVREQGLAIASCLLSGLQVFQSTYPEQARSLRVLRGFHGMHVYASEYWVEYLLYIAASKNGLDISTKFFIRSHELSIALNSLHSIEDQELEQNVLDHRFIHIKNHPEIWNAASIIASQRAGRTTQGDERNDSLSEVKGLSTLLHNYQHTVQALLKLWSFPGVSIQHLERFKQDFRSTAFTCRFWSCPLTGTGFESEALRDSHERAHAPRVPCNMPGCQYPPFTSAQALRNHLVKYHDQGVPKIRIRSPQNSSDISVPSQTRRRQEVIGRTTKDRLLGTIAETSGQAQQAQRGRSPAVGHHQPHMSQSHFPSRTPSVGLSLDLDQYAHPTANPNLDRFSDAGNSFLTPQLPSSLPPTTSSDTTLPYETQVQPTYLPPNLNNSGMTIFPTPIVQVDLFKVRLFDQSTLKPSDVNSVMSPRAHYSPVPPHPVPAPKNLKHPSTNENAEVTDAKQMTRRVAPGGNEPDSYLAHHGNLVRAHLGAIDYEVQKQSLQEAMVDIPMSIEQRVNIAAELQQIKMNMTKIDTALSNWYAITRDDQRAKMFFRTKWRIGRQVVAGENGFSIGARELAESRELLEGMAQDLGISFER
ncbi:putative NACHT domain-containing protein [Ilyonectria robusta]